MGGCFIIGNGKFLKSLYIVGRGVLTPLFYEDPPILPTPLSFSNFVQPPISLSSPTPTPHCSFCCPVSLEEWMVRPRLICYFT